MSPGDGHVPSAGAGRPNPQLAVSASVGRRFFHDRLTDQYAHHYHLIVSIFKGVALSSGAISLLAILASREAAGVKLTALALWVASLAAMIATYDGIMVTSIVASAPPNAVDLVAPFLMGLAEFTQFSVLMPLTPDPAGGEPTTAAQLEHLTWWPLVFAVLTVTATAAIANARTQMRGTVDRAPTDLQPIVHRYIRSLGQSLRSTSISSGAGVAAFLAFHFGPEAVRSWQAAFALVVLFGMVNGIVFSERARHEIVAGVAALVRPQSAPKD